VYIGDEIKKIRSQLMEKWMKEYNKNKEEDKEQNIKDIMKIVEDRVRYNMGKKVE
jgi:hypothetical protein